MESAGTEIEDQRLAALHSYGILDTPRDAAFDDLARLAADIAGAPMATVTFVDHDRQWFKAEIGLGVDQTARDISFCTHAIERDEALVVPDALLDDRFAGNPLVLGPPHIRSYTGIPLSTPDGFRVGTLCVLDSAPGRPDDRQLEMLRRVARQAEQLLEAHGQRARLEQANDALERSTRHLVEAQRIAEIGSWEVEVDPEYTWWSDGYYRILGIQRGEVDETYDVFESFIHPDDLDRFRAARYQAIRDAMPLDTEHRIVRRDGSVRWVHERAELSTEPGVVARRMAGSVQDITDRHQTEERLRESDYLRRVAGGLARLGGWAVDLATRQVVWSDEMCAILEVPAGTMPEYDAAASIWAPEYRTGVGEAYQACIRDGGVFDVEVEIITATGRRRWVRALGEAVRNDDDVVHRVHGAFIDVTDRRASEQRLREQAELLDKAKDAIVVRDLEHRIVYWNRAAERLYGWSAAEAIGRSKLDLVYPPDHSAFHAANDELHRDGEWSGRLEHRRADGRRIDVESQWTLVRDDFGQPSRVFSISTDITDRLELEQRVTQLERLESLGQLTGGVAHDFNNLLTVIIGNAELLAMSVEHDAELGQLASMIRTAGERGAQLTSRLLAFARRQALEPRAVELVGLLQGMQSLLERTLGEHVEIDLHHDPDVWPIEVDVAQLEAAILNVAINARDAMPSGGHLIIEASNVILDRTYAEQHLEVEPGPYVLLAVSDTGQGMSPETRDRAFEPFFTTKQTGRGSGLGLSMVYGFTKQSGGHVKLYSEPGHGTTVKLYLPRASTDVIDQLPTLDPVIVGGSETILLVEDDDLVRAHATQLLRDLGYHVVVAANGPDALRMLEEHGPVDLLFTDVVMPGGMNGPQVAAAVQAIQPGVRVLFTSGYTENAIVHHGRVDAGIELLHKPYRRSDLATKIRAVLDRPAHPPRGS